MGKYSALWFCIVPPFSQANTSTLKLNISLYCPPSSTIIIFRLLFIATSMRSERHTDQISHTLPSCQEIQAPNLMPSLNNIVGVQFSILAVFVSLSSKEPCPPHTLKPINFNKNKLC